MEEKTISINDALEAKRVLMGENEAFSAALKIAKDKGCEKLANELLGRIESNNRFLKEIAAAFEIGKVSIMQSTFNSLPLV